MSAYIQEFSCTTTVLITKEFLIPLSASQNQNTYNSHSNFLSQYRIKTMLGRGGNENDVIRTITANPKIYTVLVILSFFR